MSKLPPSRAMNEASSVDRLKTAIDVTDQVINSLKEDSTRGGFIGGLRSIVQKTMGIMGDITPEVVSEHVAPLAREVGLSDYFDPALPENEILENLLALELAKLRVTSGGGGIRAVGAAFKAAQKDVAITGFSSSRNVIQRLQKVREEFSTERNAAISRLTGIVKNPPPGFQLDPQTGGTN